MNDWTAGYVVDIGYTYGYYSELNPLRINLALINAGVAPPEVTTACELGFGQGLSVNIHASTSNISWSGTDFNPAQAAFAQELSAISGNNAKLYDESFEEFSARADLPEFDYIGLHGIWSWVSDENRTIVVDFIKRKLKVGGVLYISYNTQPGWAAMIPMRDLLAEHANVMGTTGQGIDTRINGALEFAEKLIATKPLFTRVNTTVVESFKKLQEQNRSYLAHEYFNQDWLPMPFSKMASWLSPAKISYACSANYLDHIDVVNLNTEQQALLAQIPDATFRQTVRDFMINQRFRKDYWVRGARNLTPLEQNEALRKIKMILIQSRGEVLLKLNTGLGEVTFQEAVYGPLLDILSDHQPKTLGQLEQLLKDRGISFEQIKEAAIVLCGTGAFAPVQEDQVIAKSKKSTEKLNHTIMMKSRSNNEISYLASPVIGGGIGVARFSQLFCLAMTQGKKNPEEWTKFVWDILAAQGQRLLKEGKTLEMPQDNIAELAEQANVFAQKQLPILKALQVI